MGTRGTLAHNTLSASGPTKARMTKTEPPSMARWVATSRRSVLHCAPQVICDLQALYPGAHSADDPS
jgi:hypothetical protein